MNGSLLINVLLITMLVATSCTEKNEVDEKLLSTYTDYVILRMSSTDTAQTARQLDGANPERMKVFYDSARSRMGRMQAEISR
jgi:hypothetical protein